MDPEQVSQLKKQASYKSTDDFPRSFKPLISIPIAISAQPAQQQPPSNNNTNLPIEVKLNAVYQEYSKLLRENKLIRVTIDRVTVQKNEILQKLNSLQFQQKSSLQDKKKRHRRNASEIVRGYQCPIENCDKSYGAQASLTQHIKLKHPEYFGSPQYEKFIDQLIKKRQRQGDQ